MVNVKKTIKNQKNLDAMILISGVTYCKIHLTWKVKSIAAQPCRRKASFIQKEFI